MLQKGSKPNAETSFNEVGRDSWNQIMENLFRTLNNKLSQNANIESSFSGSTGLVAYVSNQFIACGGVGDSRAVIYGWDGKETLLSKIHTPQDLVEKARIESKGGEIRQSQDAKGELYGPPRVWKPKTKLPGLMMTRSFGDSFGHSIGMNCIPSNIPLTQSRLHKRKDHR
jgi:serine/threonine protein phosphatase PrpC